MTIYDIAALAGVSASTVSRVINGKSGVGDEKRRKIERLLKEYNYTPDEYARSLVKQNSRTVGILTDTLNSRRQVDGTAKTENVILSSGYFCFTRYVGRELNGLEMGMEELARRKVEGALLLGVGFRDHKRVGQAICRYLPNTPIVLVNQTLRPELENVYCVGVDEGKGLRRCVQLLIKRGRKNIALFVDKDRASGPLLRENFERQIDKNQGAKGYVYMDVPPHVDGGMQQAKAALCEHPEIDGFLCVQDGIAIGAMYAAQDMGKHVPEDISVIGEDNSDLCEACRPRLTSMDTMLGVTTIMSARMLVDLLQGRTQPHCITMENEIVIRETV